MKQFELKRMACDGIKPTLGAFLFGGRPFALTLERPWLNNRKGESCIPLGTYRCVRCNASPDYDFKDSPGFGDTFQVFEVPMRDKILFHAGNVEADSHGCIIVAESFGYLGGKEAVLSSKKGFNEFLSLLKHDDEFDLAITDHYT
jgi:hypothetical protein